FPANALPLPAYNPTHRSVTMEPSPPVFGNFPAKSLYGKESLSEAFQYPDPRAHRCRHRSECRASADLNRRAGSAQVDAGLRQIREDGARDSLGGQIGRAQCDLEGRTDVRVRPRWQTLPLRRGHEVRDRDCGGGTTPGAWWGTRWTRRRRSARPAG